jgi:hypothetical protein
MLPTIIFFAALLLSAQVVSKVLINYKNNTNAHSIEGVVVIITAVLWAWLYWLSH